MLDCEVLVPALQQVQVRAFDAYARRIFFFFPTTGNHAPEP